MDTRNIPSDVLSLGHTLAMLTDCTVIWTDNTGNTRYQSKTGTRAGDIWCEFPLPSNYGWLRIGPFSHTADMDAKTTALHTLIERWMPQEELQPPIDKAVTLYRTAGENSNHRYLYEQETALLAKVRTGNVQESKALLNELIGYVLFSENRTLETVRIHAIELTTLLSRVAMDGGASTDSVYTLNTQFLSLLTREQNVYDLCYILQDVVEQFMQAMFTDRDKGNPYIRQALRFMADNYNQPLTLATVANTIHLSPNYFSSLFRTTVGVSFREHLCRIRVEESKRLLHDTRYSLTDIAVTMGFPDQSYYCKVFRRLVGITPGQYRGRQCL